MLLLLHSELFRLNRRWMPRILLLIQLGAIGALYILFWAIVRTQSESSSDVAELRSGLRLDAVRDMGLNLTFQIGGVLVVILTASLVGTEFGWGTIRTLLPRAQSRAALLTAKLITALLFALAVVIVGTVVAISASGVVSIAENLSTSFGAEDALRLLAAVGRTAYAMLPYLALTFFVTVWTRSVAAGIGIGISMLFLESLLLVLITAAGGPFERLPGILISRNVEALLIANSTGLDSSFSDVGTSTPEAGQAAAVLAVYIVGFIVLSYDRFRSRDITVG